jgi:MIP family channel proteins
VSTAVARQPVLPPAGGSTAPGYGLHGHPLDGNLVRATVVEAVGTFFLVAAIICTAIAATLGRPITAAPFGSQALPFAAGTVLAALVAALGPVSGAHLNPAITIALAVNRLFPWRYALGYVAAQMTGAIAAALAAWGCYGQRARSVAGLGGTYPAPGTGAWQVLGIETVATMLLVLVVVAVAADPRAPVGVAAVAIGFSLAAVVSAVGPVTGASVNPARSLGPMIIAGRLPDWWCYILAPLAGACAAVVLYERVFRQAAPPASGSSGSAGPSGSDLAAQERR